MPFNNKILTKLRHMKGISKYELSLDANMEQESIQRLESGKSKNPPFDTVEKLSDYFNVNMGTFLTGAVL